MQCRGEGATGSGWMGASRDARRRLITLWSALSCSLRLRPSWDRHASVSSHHRPLQLPPGGVWRAL